MPNTVSAKFWPAKPRAAKRGTRNAAMTPYPTLANTPEAPGRHAALGNKARRIFVSLDEIRLSGRVAATKPQANIGMMLAAIQTSR